jgi:carbon-monoxide dehydrogenase large subunit
MFGVPALRSEDPRFLLGEGRYLENLPIEGALRAMFVRSMMPHARLLGVDVDAARSAPGVVAVYTADDLGLPPMPPSGNVEGTSGTLEAVFGREVLARETVRFVGEPIALVVAESLATAEDAVELVRPEYEPIEAVTDVELAAVEGAPLLWPARGTNVANAFETDWDEDVLAGSDVVVEGRFVNQRVAPVPMETNAIAVVPEPGGGVTVWVSTQVPFDVRDDLADALGLEKTQVRTIAPDVGGGFGAKLQVYPEYLAVAKAAVLAGRAIRWAETRSESMLGLTHGRGQVQYVQVGARRDGSIVGLRADLLADMGAYPIAAFLPVTTQEMLSGVYAIPRIASRGRSVVTNATPIAPYRGAGRPEATALIERAIDLVADTLGLDPAEVRRRNLIPRDAFPYTTASGTTYDSGDYEHALDEALRIGDYGELRAEQAARRDRADHLQIGIGLCTYVEITSFSSKEFGSVEVHPDGHVTVLTGVTPNGQGHETAFAQMTSAVLGVPFDAVRVVHSDTGVVPRGQGTWGSRSLQAGGSAVVEQAGKVLEKARRLAAHLLETDEDDLVGPSRGGFAVRGAPDRSIAWAALAGAAADPARLPRDEEIGLVSAGRFRQRSSSFPFGAHVAVVEVDVETGQLRLVRHIAVDDCGRILNPMLVEGQVHGGLAQGIAQALFEEVRFDELGNPLSGTLTTYGMPSAAEFPWFETSHTETLTPTNPLGAKGIGESACIGATPAVQNAAVDALRHLGVRHLDLPLSPERVLRAINRAGG